jgi:hypothetical protein
MIGRALFEQSERTTQRVRGHLALFVGHTLGVDFEPQMSPGCSDCGFGPTMSHLGQLQQT